MRRMIVVLMLAGLMAGSAGCVAVAAAGAGAATVAYVRGNTEGYLQTEPARVIEAAQAVFAEMNIEVQSIEPEGEAREMQIQGKASSGESVKVTVRQLGDNVSKMWVRVGMFGDEAYSRTVYDRIEARL